MSFYIAARKDTSAVLSTDDRNTDLTGEVLTGFRAILCAKHKITDSNLSMLVLPSDDARTKRAQSGDQYSLVWTAGEITDLDFSAEDAKLILKVTVNKSVIVADGLDATTITVESWKADGSGIDKAVNATIDMPIGTPEGIRKVRVNIVNGVASRIFTTGRPGTWVLPLASQRFDGLRVGITARIEAVSLFSSL